MLNLPLRIARVSLDALKEAGKVSSGPEVNLKNHVNIYGKYGIGTYNSPQHTYLPIIDNKKERPRNDGQKPNKTGEICSSKLEIFLV